MININVGDKFGEWTTNESVNDQKKKRCSCTCSCGTTRDVIIQELIHGKSKKCREHKKAKLLESGEKYGCYTVISFDSSNKINNRSAFYKAECNCGNVSIKSYTELKRKPKFCYECRFKNLIGKQFGDWEVIDKSLGKYKRLTWKCKCKCGNVSNVNPGNLLNGTSTKCFDCGHNVSAVNDCLPGWYWSNVIAGCKNRGLQLLLTPQQARQKLDEQNCCCILSGLPLVLTSKGDRKLTTASLDRIDSKLPYQYDNIQWIHKRLNLMKQMLSNKEFIDWCNCVAKHQVGNNE